MTEENPVYGMFRDEETDKKSISELASRLKKAKAEEKHAKDMLDKIKQERMDIEAALALEMDVLSMESFKVDGTTFYIRQDFYAGAGKENQAAFFKWLRDNGHGSLIYETINSRTLSAFARETLEEGGELPDYVNVTIKKRVGVRNS